MDRLEAMSILVAVVETGSLSGASRKLGAPLPTVSRKLSDLEAHLKTRLLIRTTRKLTLTDAGADYVTACKRILEQVGDAERMTSGEYTAPRGELVVTAPIVFGRLHVLPVVTDFLANFPEINVRLVLVDRNVRLVDDHIDMAVRIGILPDSSMIATRVGTMRRVVCGSPNFFVRHGTPKAPAELSDLACVTFETMQSATSWDFTTPGSKRDQAVPITSRLSVNTAEAAVDAAIAGVGVTRVLAYQAASAVEAGKLRIVLAAFEHAPMPVNLVHAAQGLLPLKMRAFLDFAAPRLRKQLAQDAPMGTKGRHT